MKSMEWAGVLLAVAAWGCVPGGQSTEGAGGDVGAVDGGPGAGEGLVDADATTQVRIGEEFARAWGLYRCEYALRCRSVDIGLQLDGLFVDAGGDCAAWFAHRRLRIEQERPDADEIRADAARFDRCAALSLEACWWIESVPGCEQIIHGSRRDAEPCDLLRHCEPGLACLDAEAPGEDECPFECRAGLAAGEPCFWDEECVTDDEWSMFCGGSDWSAREPGVCVRYRLEAQVAEGERCGLMGDGPDDQIWHHCAPELYCDTLAGAGRSVCRRPYQPGESCSDSQWNDPPCEGGLCIDGRCTEVVVRSVAGDDCSNVDHTYCNPAANLVCVGGTCVTSDGSEGAACDARFDIYLCQPGLYCAQGVCAPELPDDAECDDEVPSGACQNYCNPVPDSERLVCGPREFGEMCGR